MLLDYTVGAAAVLTAAAPTVLDHADLWAPAVNSFLLIVLLVANRSSRAQGRRNRQVISDVNDTIGEVHENVMVTGETVREVAGVIRDVKDIVDPAVRRAQGI